MTGLDVVTCGEAMTLLLADDGAPLEHTTHLRRSIAGAESNVAIGLARLGHRAGWFGRVGDDAFGKAILRTLRGEGVDVSRAHLDPAAPTGLIIRDRHPDRPIEVAYYRLNSAGSLLCPADVDSAWLRGARIFHFTGITAALSETCAHTLDTALTIAADAGLTISFDPNVRRKLAGPGRWQHLLRPLASRSHLVLAGLDEAELISGQRGPQASSSWFLDQGARCVIVKDGSRGAWATDGTTQHQCPAHPASVLDPIGAGDAFAAGFLSAHMRALPLEHALREACAVAAAVVGTPGDIDGLPSAAQRDAILAAADAHR